MKYLLLLLLITGCGVCINGSGVKITEERDVATFSSVVLSGAANVYITQDGTNSVKVETDDNIMPVVETNVIGSRLNIKTDCYTGDVDVYLTMDMIRELSITGSGQIIGGDIETDDLEIGISGSGTIQANLDAKNIDSAITGSGKINLAGTADAIEHKVTGSGDLNAFELSVKAASISVMGSGKSQVNAEDSLDVSIMGSGNVVYKGSPKVNYDGSGSGSVKAS